MVVLDIILGLILIYGLYKGLKNGLIVELAALVALIGGIYGAIRFSYIVGDYLGARLDWDPRYIKLAAFIITFCIIVLVVHLLGRLLTKVADFAMLGIFNTLAGGAFGLIKMAVILGALLVFFDRFNASTGLVDESQLEASVLYDPVRVIGSVVFDWVLEPRVSEVPTPANP